eukprot:663514-Prorocentrum_minimum.AAC.1
MPVRGPIRKGARGNMPVRGPIQRERGGAATNLLRGEPLEGDACEGGDPKGARGNMPVRGQIRRKRGGICL